VNVSILFDLNVSVGESAGPFFLCHAVPSSICLLIMRSSVEIVYKFCRCFIFVFFRNSAADILLFLLKAQFTLVGMRTLSTARGQLGLLSVL